MKTFDEFLNPLYEATERDLQKMGATPEQIKRLKQRQAQRGKGFSSGDSRVEPKQPVGKNLKALPPSGGALAKTSGSALTKSPSSSLAKSSGGALTKSPNGSLAKSPGGKLALSKKTKPSELKKSKTLRDKLVKNKQKRKGINYNWLRTDSETGVGTSGDLEGPGRGIYNPSK